jgi:hypothetical protein
MPSYTVSSPVTEYSALNDGEASTKFINLQPSNLRSLESHTKDRQPDYFQNQSPSLPPPENAFPQQHHPLLTYPRTYYHFNIPRRYPSRIYRAHDQSNKIVTHLTRAADYPPLPVMLASRANLSAIQAQPHIPRVWRRTPCLPQVPNVEA